MRNYGLITIRPNDRNITVGENADDRHITVRRDDRDQTMHNHGLITVRPDDGNRG